MPAAARQLAALDTARRIETGHSRFVCTGSKGGGWPMVDLGERELAGHVRVSRGLRLILDYEDYH
jgi:hypothetical protein